MRKMLDGMKKISVALSGSAMIGFGGIPDKVLPYYTAALVAYLLVQGAVDVVKVWKGK